MSNCKNCSLSVPKTNAQCDGCQGHLHLHCVGITESEAKVMTRLKSKFVKLFCNECNNDISKFKNIKSLVESMQKQIESLREDLQAQIRSLSTANMQQPMSNDETFENVVQEVHERQKRKNNILIFGLAEQQANQTNAIRAESDRAAVGDVIAFLGQEVDSDGATLHRVGRLDPDSTRPRPVKVTLSSEAVVLKLIRNAKKLKSSERFARIFISFDRTPRQLNYYREVKRQLQERIENGETNLKIKYINDVPKIVNLN